VGKGRLESTVAECSPTAAALSAVAAGDLGTAGRTVSNFHEVTHSARLGAEGYAGKVPITMDHSATRLISLRIRLSGANRSGDFLFEAHVCNAMESGFLSRHF